MKFKKILDQIVMIFGVYPDVQDNLGVSPGVNRTQGGLGKIEKPKDELVG